MKHNCNRLDCVICNRPITRSTHAPKFKERRSPIAVTCNRFCSKIYNRLPRKERPLLLNNKTSIQTLRFKYRDLFNKTWVY